VSNGNDIIERFTHAGRAVTICRDDQCEDPRKSDNIAILVCCHRRHQLGDEQMREPLSEAQIRESVPDVLAILPLYLFDHSGITIRTTPFSCHWDSGQIGWAYVTKASAAKMGEPGNQAHYEDIIRQEVATYDDYITGRCYGYTVKGIEGDVIDSCWGFVGDLDYVRQEAKSAAEGSEDPAAVRGAEALAARATFAAGGDSEPAGSAEAVVVDEEEPS
jgi:hypothetical protein